MTNLRRTTVAYDNNSDSTTLIYQKAGTGGTIDYSSLSLNSSVADADQLIVIRKFTPTDTFKTTAAPNGVGGVYPDGEEWWDIWTLKNSSSSGSPMYTLNTAEKKITMSTTTSNYYWNRTNSDGTVSQVYLPVYDANTDDVIVMRKTYALDNFVNWMAGTRVTSKNLNLNSDQLLNLLQELVTNFRREDLVNPFVGAADGICPLDSSGYIPAAYLTDSSITSALGNITFTAGDGLTGGGTLGANRTFDVDLDTTLTNGLSIVSNKLALGLGTSLKKTGDLVDVNTLTGGGLEDSGSGLKVKTFTTLGSVTTATDTLVTSSVVKELKDDVDALGTGIRFLGGLDPLTKATATVTVTDYTNLAASDKVTLKQTSAPTVDIDFVAGTDWAIGGTNDATATNIAAAIDGHAGFTATASTNVVTITQANAGDDGNTSVVLTDAGGAGMSKTDFTGGTDGTEPSTPSGGFVAGDTFDVLHDGFTSASWADSSWATLAVTQGHDVRYNGTAWESIPPVTTVDLSDYVKRDGTATMTGDFNVNSNDIINVPDVANDTTTELQYATSKNWVLNKAFALTPLHGIKDVATYATPAAKSILVWNFADTDNNWKTKTLSTLSVGELDDFDMTTSAPSDGDVLSWDGSNWVPSSAYGNPQVWSSRAGTITGGLSGKGDGTTTAFTLTSKPSSTNPNSFVVSLDGVMQIPGQDFTSVTASSTEGILNFAAGAAPPYGAEISVYNIGKLSNLPPSGFDSSDPGSVPLTVTGHSTQTANLQEWKDGTPSVVASVSASGALDASAITVGGLASIPIRQLNNTQWLTTNTVTAPYTSNPIDNFTVTGVYNTMTPLSTNSSILVMWKLRYVTNDGIEPGESANNAGGRAAIVKGNTAGATVGGTPSNGQYVLFGQHNPYSSTLAAGSGWTSAYNYGDLSGVFIIPASEHTLDPLRLDLVASASSGDTMKVYPSYCSLIMIEIGG